MPRSRPSDSIDRSSLLCDQASLRFADLVRVSTEKQESKGESLRTQRKSTERDIDKLGGRIVERYGGQEHATPGWEKGEVDRLLADAAKKKFDAVMVAYADRWSRDNAKSKEGLEILRKNGIRFYVGATEMDLFDPQVRFLLGMHAEVGEFIASQQNKKSLENRIERARRGIPSVGRNPYGRFYDRKTNKWVVDEQKKKDIIDIANRYLHGEGLEQLAKEYGWQTENALRKILRERCGDTWLLSFKSESLNIDEVVPLAVPRLLEEKTIRAIRDRLEGNRTYLHGNPKHPYLLNGRIFCGVCGLNLTGKFTISPNGFVKTYYRHSNTGRKKCPCRPLPNVPADKIEEKVIHSLFQMFGNPAAITRAIKASVPNCDESFKRRNRLVDELEGIKKARQNVLTFVTKGIVEMSDAEIQLRGLKERETVLNSEVERLDISLTDVPTEEALQCYVERIERVAFSPIMVTDEEGNTYAGGNDVQSYIMMTHTDRKRLIEAVFAGPLVDGKPAGVYVSPEAGIKYRPKKWTYSIRGRLDFELVLNQSGRLAQRSKDGRSQESDASKPKSASCQQLEMQNSCHR